MKASEKKQNTETLLADLWFLMITFRVNGVYVCTSVLFAATFCVHSIRCHTQLVLFLFYLKLALHFNVMMRSPLASCLLKNVHFSAAEMRVTQLSRLRLGQVVGIMATIVMASCAIFTVPKHIQVTYPVVANYERTRHAVQSPVLNSFNRELWLNGIMQLQVPFHINDGNPLRRLASNIFISKTDQTRHEIRFSIQLFAFSSEKVAIFSFQRLLNEKSR